MTYSLTVLLLSGAIAGGKTTLARNLSSACSARHISTSRLLGLLSGTDTLERSELQDIGLASGYQEGQWIIDAITQAAADRTRHGPVVVDAVRTLRQIADIRRAAAGDWRIVHVHLTGDPRQLAGRYRPASPPDRPWGEAMRSPAEAAVSDLEAEADAVIDTTTADPADVTARVLARIASTSTRGNAGLYADVLVGGQWGSEGKGNLAFHLAPEYDLLIRAGAPNAGHKICDRDGTVYTHRQLPSGTRATTCPLLLGPGAVIDIAILLREVADCRVDPGRLAIDPAALIIEQDDVAAESALKSAIGSTGTGGGAALARRITHRGQPGAVRLAKDIPQLKPYIRDSADVIASAERRGGRILLEGTQGTGLSIIHGAYPHVTSRDTTASAVIADCGIPPNLVRRVLVVFRAYPIRVGGPSGTMGREIGWDTVASRSGQDAASLTCAERGSVSGSQRRVAEFSWTQLRDSVRLNGATDLALTFADYLDQRNRDARRYGQLTTRTAEFIAEMETIARAGIPDLRRLHPARPYRPKTLVSPCGTTSSTISAITPNTRCCAPSPAPQAHVPASALSGT